MQQQVLLQALSDRRHQIADLQIQLNQTEVARMHEAAEADRQLALREEDLAQLRAEKEALQAAVLQLEEQLVQAQKRYIQAEERCAAIEQQLEAVERSKPAHMLEIDNYKQASLPKKATILIVDSDESRANRVRDVIRALDQNVILCSTGERSLVALRRARDVAVVLVESSLGGGGSLDAYDLAARIKSSESNNIPVIFLGAPREAHAAFRAYASGAADSVTTPVDPWVLRAKVAIFVELYWKTVLTREAVALIESINRSDED
ncbi:response regulator [Streptomyces sp. NPDC045431]|uniref:response regulator n=1 Tax=Streptomyces sp. NPDC045431 TaxID=3155613 RepID=UPI0033BFC22E